MLVLSLQCRIEMLRYHGDESNVKKNMKEYIVKTALNHASLGDQIPFKNLCILIPFILRNMLLFFIATEVYKPN